MGLFNWFWLSFQGIFVLIAAVIVVVTNVRRFRLCNGNVYDILGEDRVKERISCLSIIFGLIMFVAVNTELEIILPLRLLVVVVAVVLSWFFLEFCSWVSRLAKEGWIYEKLSLSRKRGGRGYGRTTELRPSEIRRSSSTDRRR
ncbi:hypothetical protein IJH72_00840 [Candidatus Saccharibacteria bacterium]|nr:hypothetical protein [Candidatus Saccharibacteria bacterium]